MYFAAPATFRHTINQHLVLGIRGWGRGGGPVCNQMSPHFDS